MLSLWFIDGLFVVIWWICLRMWFAWFYCLLLFVGVVCYALRFVVRFDVGLCVGFVQVLANCC